MLVLSLLASCVHSLRPKGGPVELGASMLEAACDECPAYRYENTLQWQKDPAGILNFPALKANQKIRYSCKAVATWEWTANSQFSPNWKDIEDNYVTAECSAQCVASFDGSCFV